MLADIKDLTEFEEYMEKQKAIKILQDKIHAINGLRILYRKDPNFRKWKRDTEVAIEHIFGKGTRHGTDFFRIQFFYPNMRATKGDHQQAYLKGLTEAPSILQSFIDEINEYWPDEMPQATAPTPTAIGTDIFIVHGHDGSAKQTVARFIEKLKLRPIILHEQPNKGRTIIEKFEDHADVGFAVVLMTPDDVGALAEEKDKLNPRARQNVILELGFFLGKLGRKHVCALYKENVEMPSDYKGVLFIPMDKNNGWQLSLAKEIKAAGISIDLNKTI